MGSEIDLVQSLPLIGQSEMKAIIELKLGEKIQELVDGCCVVCTPGCCGRGAYNFTPLQIAAYLYRDPNAEVLESDFEAYRHELRILLESGEQLEPDENGLICSIAGMNQCFSRESLERFVSRLWRSIELAPSMLLYSGQLEEDKGKQPGMERSAP